jgi:hypothetical protein
MNISYPSFVGAPLPEDKELLAALRGSEFVRKVVAERNTTVLAFRKTAADKLAKLEAAAEVSFPKLRKAKERAEASARAAEIAWRDACTVAQQAQRDLSSASHTHSAEQLKLEQQLAETASPEIALFIADMRDQVEATFKQFRYQTASETENVVTGKKRDVTVNNAKSIQARQEAIRDAIGSAEAMKLDPDQASVPARLQDLRNNLPAISGI